jgi:hypothetical protein
MQSEVSCDRGDQAVNMLLSKYLSGASLAVMAKWSALETRHATPRHVAAGADKPKG